MRPIYYGILALALFCVGQVVYGGNSTPIINTFNCFSSAGGKICAPTSHSTIKVVGVTNTPGTNTITISPGSVGAVSTGVFSGYTSVGGGRATANQIQAGILSVYNSATAPATTGAHNPFWCDTSTTPAILKIRNGTNTDWISIGTLADSTPAFWASNAVNATHAADATNARTVGNYTPSVTPGANQIPVLDSSGHFGISMTFVNGINVPTQVATDNTYLAASTQFTQAAIAASVPVWATPTFSAGNFVGGGNTWTVASGAVGYNRYYQVGKKMRWVIYLYGTSVAGSSGNTFYLTIPNGAKTTRTGFIGSFTYSDNGTYGQGLVSATSNGGTTLQLFKNFALTNWAASTTNTAIVMNIEFETQ